MNTAPLYRATVLGLTWLAGSAGHETGDYLVQLDSDAQRKQGHTRPEQPGWPGDDRTPCQRVHDGHVSLLRHAFTYGLTQAATKAAAYRLAGVRVPLAAQAAGTVTEIALHALIDDGRLLRRFAQAVGKLGFHDLNAGGVNGRMLLDQATHKGLQVPLGAMVTTAAAAALTSRRGRS
jgi:hypothetical protein